MNELEEKLFFEKTYIYAEEECDDLWELDIENFQNLNEMAKAIFGEKND